MAKIHRLTDRITVEVGDVKFKISPLSYHQKQVVSADLLKAATGDAEAAMSAVKNGIKFCLKDIEGVIVDDEEGNEVPYELDFDDNGELSDDCISELLNAEFNNELSSIASNMLAGVPDKIVDHEGNVLEGVKVINPKGKKPRKKSSPK